MEKEKNKYEEIGKEVIEYVDTRIEHTKLSFISNSIEIGASAASSFIVILLFTVFYFCFVCGFSLWLGTLYGGAHFGFFIVTVVHFILLVLVIFLKKFMIEIPIQNKLTRIIFKSKK